MDAQEDFLKDTNAYLRVLPQAMDYKIAVLSAAALGSFIFVLNLSKELRWVGSHPSFGQIVLGLMLVMAWIGCGLAVLSGFAALWARTSGNEVGVRSLVSIAACGSADQYVARIAGLDEQQTSREVARHNFELASIAMRKIQLVNRSVAALVVGIFAAAASVADLVMM